MARPRFLSTLRRRFLERLRRRQDRWMPSPPSVPVARAALEPDAAYTPPRLRIAGFPAPRVSHED